MIGSATAILVVLLALGLPVAAALGILALTLGDTYAFLPVSRAIGEIAWSASTDFILVAIPLFILLGEILLRSGIAERLLRSLAAIFRGLPGGYAFAVAVIGVVMAFGLGLGVLFLALYGRIGTGFALLTGQVVSVGVQGLSAIAITTAVVLAVLAVIYRPLLFASMDPRVAEANGVPRRALSVVFAILVGLACAQGVQIIGALLVMSLMITPGAAAARLTANPAVAAGLSVAFAEVAAVGGLLLSLAPKLPVSVFVTTISFVIYLVCRVVGRRRGRVTRERFA